MVSKSMEEIGQIKFIRRYPVKSMMGEDLNEATIEISGIVGDRIYAFVDDKLKGNSFHWMTARQAPEFLLHKPRFAAHNKAGLPGVVVICPDGREYSVVDKSFEEYLEAKYGYEISMKHSSRGCFDARPISLLSMQTVRQLEKETKLDYLAHERFRANFYADWSNDQPFYEDELLEKTLQIGERVRIRIVKKDSRCVIPTLDPETSVASPVVLETIQKRHKGRTGVYAEVEETGTVRLGDRVVLV